MQVVRIVTAVLYALVIAVTKSVHGNSAPGVSVRRQRVPLRGALTYSGRARVFWHIATCGRPAGEMSASRQQINTETWLLQVESCCLQLGRSGVLSAVDSIDVGGSAGTRPLQTTCDSI